MKIAVIGRFKEQAQIRVLTDTILRPAGFTVCSRWLSSSREEEELDPQASAEWAMTNVEDLSRAEQMLSTIRHNRARGQHGVLKMGKIVRELKASGLSEEDLERRLKMEPEEQERLADLRTSPKLRGKDSYGLAWVPDPDGHR